MTSFNPCLVNVSHGLEALLPRDRRAVRLRPVLGALVPFPVDPSTLQYHVALTIQSDAQEFIYKASSQLKSEDPLMSQVLLFPLGS